MAARAGVVPEILEDVKGVLNNYGSKSLVEAVSTTSAFFVEVTSQVRLCGSIFGEVAEVDLVEYLTGYSVYDVTVSSAIIYYEEF